MVGLVSIDYRTTEELGDVDSLRRRLWSTTAALRHRHGLSTLENVESSKQLQQSVAMYGAQRIPSRASMVVANADTYNIDVDQIAVGGAQQWLDHDHRAGHQR